MTIQDHLRLLGVLSVLAVVGMGVLTGLLALLAGYYVRLRWWP